MRLTNRAQSIGISQLILALVTGAIMIYLISYVGDEFLPGAKSATTNSTANQATDWMIQFQDLVPIIILVLGFFFIVVLAIYRSEVR